MIKVDIKVKDDKYLNRDGVFVFTRVGRLVTALTISGWPIESFGPGSTTSSTGLNYFVSALKRGVESITGNSTC
jgi:hypothetical protein